VSAILSLSLGLGLARATALPLMVGPVNGGEGPGRVSVRAGARCAYEGVVVGRLTMEASFFWLASRALSRWLPRAIVSIRVEVKLERRWRGRIGRDGTGKGKRKC